MIRTFLYPYHRASQSAKNLANGIGVRRLRRVNSKVRLRSTDTILNWGSNDTWFDPDSVDIINDPRHVSVATNKLLFFQKAVGEDLGFKVPQHTTDLTVASTWPLCVSRTMLRASGGRGIIITEKNTTPPAAPLYVKYIKKQKEFRIHVAFGKVFDTQRKIANPDMDEPLDWQVRNHDNGFIFVRGSGEPTQTSLSAAIACVNHFGLHFGAVDVIETKSKGTYVLEINTAPGLTGTTLTNYVEMFKENLEHV